MNDLFDQAKQVGLSHALEWLPPGTIRGAEYVCKNPTRADNSIGSFCINLTTGRWGDFADDAAGNDLVSCYAYINRSSLEQKSWDKRYKNIDAGIQTEAATELLERFNPFALAIQDKPKEKGKFWDGYRQITTGLREPLDPKDTFAFYSKMWGEFKNHWEFTDKKGRVMFIVARFFQDGKKNDRPFTPWTDGRETKWRSKNLEGVLLPLYNLTGLEENQNLPVLITEGQKNAEHSRELLIDSFVTTAYYRGIDKTDIEPLRGRTVYYWFDPDGAGRAKLKKVKDALAGYDVIFHAVHSPTGKSKGWDISDAIEEGWDKQKIVDHILKTEPVKTKPKEVGFIDDGDFPYRIIGQTANDIYFFVQENCMVMKIKRSALGKANLMNIMPRELWGAYYSKPDGGIAWDAAADFIIREAAKADVFSPQMIRGTGAWVEGGKTIINTGKKLIVDGVEKELFQKSTKFIYEKRKSLPYTVGNPGETALLGRIVKQIDFAHADYGRLLAGWILLAPFGGALPWRPHSWLSGPQGAGKSYILDQIVAPMVREFGVMGNGSSTVAGMRQALGSCTQPMILDEAEGDTIKKREVIDEALTLARIASSGGENPMGMLHGNQDGTGTVWLVGSMFLFASIGATIIHSADKNRITLLKLNSPSVSRQQERAELFKKLQYELRGLTPDFIRGFHARTLGLWKEVLSSVEMFTEVVAEVLGTRREGDQVGTLVAGVWMVDHDNAPTLEEAEEFAKTFTSFSGSRVSEKQDGELCMDEIMLYTLEIDHKKMSVGSWLMYWFSSKRAPFADANEFSDMPIDYSMPMIKRNLAEVGVKPVVSGPEFGVQIATNHPKIRAILRNTPWPNTYPEIMERVGYCIKANKGPSNFGPTQKRFNEFKAESFLVDEIPF